MNWDAPPLPAPPERMSLEKRVLLATLAERTGFDRALIAVLERLFMLPVTTTESCSGHLVLDGGGMRLDGTASPYLQIAEDEQVSEVEAAVQRRLREEVGRLGAAIAGRVGDGAVGVSLEGYIDEIPDEGSPDGYRLQRLTMEETLGSGLPYTLRFAIRPEAARASDGFDVLRSIWEEVCSYIDLVRGQPAGAVPHFTADQFEKR